MTLRQAKTSSTLTVIILPFALRIPARLSSTAPRTLNTPLTLPVAFGHLVKRRRQTINVITYVAVVAQQKPGLVSRLAAALAHRTVQTPPAFIQHHIADAHARAVRVVALAALRTTQQAIGVIIEPAETAAVQTHVLLERERVV